MRAAARARLPARVVLLVPLRGLVRLEFVAPSLRIGGRSGRSRLARRGDGPPPVADDALVRTRRGRRPGGGPPRVPLPRAGESVVARLALPDRALGVARPPRRRLRESRPPRHRIGASRQ